MDGENIVQVEHLRTGYGNTIILQGIDLGVQQAEIVAVIGRNGMGKSTLMKCIIGLLPVTDGRIVYNGTDLTKVPAHKRAQLGIGYVPQGREVFSTMTVEENLMVGELVNTSKTEKLYDFVYEYFPILKERRRQKAGSLSGGEQQMLAIGRALVGNPVMLLLDEPSEGIQPSIVQQIGENISQINRDIGLTVLFVEQNIDMIVSLAQRCYVIDNGKIVDQLSRSELTDTATLRRYLAV
jgi:urea ABC transporter ATP-binding protein UrtE